MISRENDHHVAAISLDGECGERDCRSRIPAEWLADHPPADQLGRLLRRQRQVTLIGDHVRIFSGNQRRDAGQRCLEEALIAEQRQERFWAGAPAQRPEPRTASSCQDDGVHRRVCVGRHPAALATG